ncbi:P-loop containing nucleoside triphosphate hydrolase protein [Naviculisporaceae sp. PSN 640]
MSAAFLPVQGSLPSRAHPVFPFRLFNRVQSACFPHAYHTNDNLVVSAPTGSGKTAVLEVAICKLALGHNGPFKIVYQAPTKSLCSERARDWSTKFSSLGLRCAELTGDTTQAELKRVAEATIIITTPEKWDSITRKWEDHRKLVQLVKLFLIDEVHFLKDIRGATLEAVVSRMKTIGENIRFIALSATIPNSDDIAKWLGRNHTHQEVPALQETFGEDVRPVKLQKAVYGYDCNGNDYVFDKYLDSKLPAVIARHCTQKKPILVFCFTRKSCENTARKLADYASTSLESPWPTPAGTPNQRIPLINRELQELVRFGVAFHHAGLDSEDRQAIEANFLAGNIGVICSTSTLAVGINLPCHTVIVKGTVGFADDALKEYSDLEVMQMLGRAGRPQFGNEALAVIMTRAGNKQRYERMVSGQEVIESTLHLNLIEHLNSEISLHTVTNLRQAQAWLGGTFLNVRIRRNAAHYKLAGSLGNVTLEQICERDVNQLREAKLIRITRTDQFGETFWSTEYGRAMSKYMVQFPTMRRMLTIKRGAGLEEIITILSQATEFNDFRFKSQERAIFKDLNKNPVILFPVKEPVNETWQKMSLMVQSYLGNIDFPDSGDAAKLRMHLVKERSTVMDKMARLIRALVDCKAADKDSVGMFNSLELLRAVMAGA